MGEAVYFAVFRLCETENDGTNQVRAVSRRPPEVALLRSKLVRAGQQTSTGETMPDRHIHHLRVLQRREGAWQIVSHLISQAHERR